MNKLIAHFKYNKTNFFISLINDKKILFSKDNGNGEIKTELTSLEYDMVNKVYKTLYIDLDKAIFIEKIATNDKEYSLFYDYGNDNYFWKSSNDIYNKNDNILFNFKYNHQLGIEYSNYNKEKNDKSSNKFYNKLVGIGKKLIVVSIAATMSLNMLVGCTVLDSSAINNFENVVVYAEEIPDPIEPIEIEYEYNYDDIRQAIENNPNIGSEEKELLYKLKFVFDESYQYMNLDSIIKKLSTLRLNYVGEKNSKDTSGYYERLKNEITFRSANFEETNIGTFVHEFGHVLQDNKCSHFLGEWSNEVWSREVLIRLYTDTLVDKEDFISQFYKEVYANEGVIDNEEEFLGISWDVFNSGYQHYISVYCILADLLPDETLKKYQFNQSINIIVDELLKIDMSSDEKWTSIEDVGRAYQLIHSFDKLREYSFFKDRYEHYYDLGECFDKLNYYYEKVYGINIDDSFENNLYVNSTRNVVTGSYFDGDKFKNFVNDKYNVNLEEDLLLMLFVKMRFYDTKDTSIFIWREDETYPEIKEFNDVLEFEFREYKSMTGIKGK